MNARPDAPRRILLVAASAELRDAARELLERLGHRVLATARPEEADLPVESVDLAVVEAFAGPEGGASGLALVDALRRRRPDLPALLLTTYGEDPPLRERVRAGEVALLAMPASAEALERAVAEALSARPRSGAAPAPRSAAAPWGRILAGAGFAAAIGLGALLLRSGPPRLPEIPAEESQRGRAVELLVPLGELAASPRILAWEAEPGAARYRIEILGVDGTLLWTTETERTEVAAPARELPLREAVRYAWRVQALAADGTLLASSDRAWFEVVPAAARRGGEP